ncbi:MAG: ATP-dependent helicase, partial [Bdellovibrionales bacterium]|nr:ATP-dependent helicase [Bdellovibrionales bacterium]
AKKLGPMAKKVWSGTFHGFGLQFLKEHHEIAKLPKKFGVIDTSDSEAILRDLMHDLKDFDKEDLNRSQILNFISEIRQRGKLSEYNETSEAAAATLLAPKFMKQLHLLGVVDFEELLLRPLKILRNHQDLKEKMQRRFDYVMVDEFQDTNLTQMRLIDELINEKRNITVVGDDDQSIYGWRGAEIQNILSFPNRYKGCEVIRLERNYRSTPPILNLANSIIATNKDRHVKALIPSLDEEGRVPELFIFENEEVEVDEIVRELNKFHNEGFAWRDMALLYRSNSQGALMEGALRRSQIPYKITGGSALFDRKEVKDILAYIRCAVFPNEIALRRVINLPARGLGEKAIESILNSKGRTFPGKALNWAKENPEDKAAQALSKFFDFLDHLKEDLVQEKESAETLLCDHLRQLGYRDYISRSYKSSAAIEARWLSASILGRILDGMFSRNGRTLDTLENFVNCMELQDPVEDKEGQIIDEVQLMTLHACKGLEFPIVFLMGLEEDLLPHARLGTNTDEERRLFYVGVTRAKKHLMLTRVRQRKRYGRLQTAAPSRFLLEIDPQLFCELPDGRPLAVGEKDAMLKALFQKLHRQKSEKDSVDI